eukprot:TRINITY_DN6937_c0_g1_i1.p1 TRINITY_DN6937_c0_g1~~TRINITY_DN6937_c0_g1_i1.p1  ORF type:complete len:186 (-),score=9.90 TRINITY_DN6937_c0_g1_i1:7-564(-)
MGSKNKGTIQEDIIVFEVLFRGVFDKAAYDPVRLGKRIERREMDTILDRLTKAKLNYVYKQLLCTLGLCILQSPFYYYMYQFFKDLWYSNFNIQAGDKRTIILWIALIVIFKVKLFVNSYARRAEKKLTTLVEEFNNTVFHPKNLHIEMTAKALQLKLHLNYSEELREKKEATTPSIQKPKRKKS